MNADKHQKQPKVPVLPPNAQATAQKLHRIIDAGGEQAPLAYGLLSRLCVFWTEPSSLPGEGQAQDVFDDMLYLMTQLFPNGEGLPDGLGSGT